MGTDGLYNPKDAKAKLDYLKELLTDRNILANDPRTYLHVGKILDKEILRVRSALFSTYGINPISDSDLPDPEGPKVNLQTKVYMPNDDSNSFNFVGRILGPDGSTAKCLQQCLGVKIMVRGRGSMRDRKKEAANIGKPNWEHLSDKLHVVLTVEDHENRAKARLAKASEYVTLFLKESMKGSDKDDKVKQMQLMELSFRRESCPSWRANYNNSLDFALAQKLGPVLSNAAANFLNFGYAYPPSGPLFSPVHHHSLSHPQLGPYGHQQPGQQQQQPHTVRQQHQQSPTTPPLANHAGNNHPHLAAPTGAYSHPYANNNLNAAAFLLGHSPTSVAGYASPYASPSSHAAAAAAAASALAVTPMNYWTGQGVSHLSNDYTYAKPGPLLNGLQLESYSDEVSPLTTTTALHPTGGSLSQSRTHVYLQTPGNAAPEDLMQQCMLPDMSADGFAMEFDPRLGAVQHPQVIGLYHTGANMQPVKLPTSSAEVASTHGKSNTALTMSNGPTKSLGKRYSQKTHHASNRSGPNRPTSITHTTGSGRSAVVTVRIGSSTEPHSLSSLETSEALTESDADSLVTPSSSGPSNGRPSLVVKGDNTNGRRQTRTALDSTSADASKPNTPCENRRGVKSETSKRFGSQLVTEKKHSKSPEADHDSKEQEGHEAATRKETLVVVT